jgi:hypothetical protein
MLSTDMTFTACLLGRERPDRKLATLEIVLTAPQAGDARDRAHGTASRRLDLGGRSKSVEPER